MLMLKHTSICMELKSRNQARFVELCKHEKNTCEKLQGHNEWLRTFCQQGSSVEETWTLPARPPDGNKTSQLSCRWQHQRKKIKGDSIVNKRLMKVAVTTALTVAFAVPAFANPFSDVPAKHWAYDSVNKLVQAGIVDGYGDGTFRGDKTMTRYEMATIVAKAMTKSLNADQKATVDRLSKEFGTELTTMGIKVDSLQKQVDNSVKISGDARVRYFDHATNADRDLSDYRARVTFDGKVNDNMKFNARISSGNALIEGKANTMALDTANVAIKGLGMNNTIGRQDIKLGSGYLIDGVMNGITAQYGDLKMFGGNASSNGKVTVGATTDTIWSRMYGAEYKMDILGAKVTADFLKNTSEQTTMYGANAGFKVIDGVNGNVEYFKNNDGGAKAMAYGVKFNKIGLAATYRDVEAGAFSPFSGMVTSTTNQYSVLSADGFKGMEYQYDHSLDKNTILTVKYQDFKNQAGTKLDARTSAAINVKF